MPKYIQDKGVPGKVHKLNCPANSLAVKKGIKVAKGKKSGY